MVTLLYIRAFSFLGTDLLRLLWIVRFIFELSCAVLNYLNYFLNIFILHIFWSVVRLNYIIGLWISDCLMTFEIYYLISVNYLDCYINIYIWKSLNYFYDFQTGTCVQLYLLFVFGPAVWTITESGAFSFMHHLHH